MSYAIIAGALALIGALVVFAVRYGNAKAKELGRQEVINEVQTETIDATRRADVVLNQHRTVDDTASRLRDGSF